MLQDNICNGAGGSVFTKQFDAEGRMRIIDGMRYYKKTEAQNNMARCIIRLRDTVDAAALEYAAELALKRHRVFSFTVCADEKRYYLRQNHEKPIVHFDGGGRYTVGTEENRGYLTRIGYNGDAISVDFFHGVSDGMGVISFIRTLLYYYGLRRYGRVEAPPGLLLLETPEDPREYAQGLLFVPEETVAAPEGYQWERAFQIPQRHMECAYASKRYELRVDAEAFEGFMRSHGSSRSAVFAWCMNRAIAQENGVGEAPIVAALAVNARKAYGAQMTEQCCVGTVPLWYDGDIAALSDDAQLKAYREMIVEGTQAQRLIAAAQRTRKFNEMLEERCPALEEKKAFARKVNKEGGVKYSYGLSYVGGMRAGGGIDAYVREIHGFLCANTSPMILEIAKCGAHYLINYSTHLQEDPYVQRLADILRSAGIGCSCEQKEDFLETLAVF